MTQLTPRLAVLLTVLLISAITFAQATLGPVIKLGTSTTTGLPASSTTITGGLMYDLDAGSVKVNNGTSWANISMFPGAIPTISSGFGTSPSVTIGYTSAFRVNVGTGGAAASGVIGLPTAANGWNCDCTDVTTASATVFVCKQTANTTTTVTIGNFATTGLAAAWTASDILAISCEAIFPTQ